MLCTSEPRHDKTNKVNERPAKTQNILGIRPVWSESSLCAWRNIGSLATHWAHSEDSDQTGRMPRLIWVFAGRTLILLVCHVVAQVFSTVRSHSCWNCVSFQKLNGFNCPELYWEDNQPVFQPLWMIPRFGVYFKRHLSHTDGVRPQRVGNVLNLFLTNDPTQIWCSLSISLQVFLTMMLL